MRTICCSLSVILFAAFGKAVPVTMQQANSNQEIVVERATEEEARQVQEVADAFEKRMRETRDVASLSDLFIADFVRLQMEEEKASHPGQPLVLIPSIPLSIEADLTSKVTQQEWKAVKTDTFK